jgi:peptide/nickel transport system substrate-binding protein
MGCVDPREQAPAGTMVVAQELASSWVRNFNPLLNTGTTRVAATACMYEPLFIFNTVTGEWTPRLAKEFHWVEPGKILEFRLRDGLRWSDGHPLGVEDVLFSFEALRQTPSLDSNGIWSFVESIESPEDLVVRFHFSRAYVPGLTFVAQQALVPKHIFSAFDNLSTFTNPDPVGSGPFTEVLLWEQQVWDLGKNPHYWQPGKPAVEVLRFPAFPDNEQANIALIRGELDWAGTFVPAVDRIFVDRDPEHHHYWFPTLSSTIFLFANTQRGVLGDKRVRQALSHGIDRSRVVRVGMFNTTQASSPTGLSLAHKVWIDRELESRSKWTEHDPQSATALLQQAGMVLDNGVWTQPNGETLELEIIVPAGWSDWVRSAQVMVQDLKRIGLKVNLKTLDFGAWLNAVQKGDFDLAMGWGQRGATPYEFFRGLMDTRTVLPLGETALSNWHRFGIQSADALLDALEKTTDSAAQQKIVHQLQALFVQEAPAIPLFPGPIWGTYNDSRFTGFPNAENAYAVLPPNRPPESLITLAELRPQPGAQP